MDCCVCGKRMDKLTRTQFSYNTKEGHVLNVRGLARHSRWTERGRWMSGVLWRMALGVFGHRNTLNTRRLVLGGSAALWAPCTAGDGSRSIQ